MGVIWFFTGLAVGWFLLPRPLWIGDFVSDLKYKWRNRGGE